MAPRLVGRHAELQALTAAVAGVAAGRGGFVVVAGEAGVGKSRLLAEVVTRARGLAVLTGRSVETGGSPLRPLVEAFLAAFRDRPPPSDPQLLPFRAALSPLVPEWHSERTRVEPVVRNEGVLRLLRALGGPDGCVLVLEDLHWADPETLTVVEHLADHARHERVLCVATVRSDQPSAGLARIRSLALRGAATIVELARMSDAEVAEVAGAAAGEDLDPAAARVVCERAEGLPLLAEDLVATARLAGATVADVVPMTFAGTVHTRLAALPPGTADVVRAAAMLGRRFDWRLLGPIAGVDDAAVAAALRTAADAQLVVADPAGGFAFRHALTRDAVLADVLPTERAQLARRALEVVEALHPGLPEEWTEVAAGLAHDAGDGERAAILLVESARRALAGGALSAAEETLERAKALVPPDGTASLAVDELRLEVLSLAGKTDGALVLGEALLARQTASAAAVTQLRLARAAAAATRWDTARRHVAEARRLAGADSRTAAEADALEASVAVTEGRFDEAVVLAEGALAAGRDRSVAEAMCEALEVLGRVARRTDLDAAERWFEQAARAAQAAGLHIWEIRALHELGTIDMFRSAHLGRLEQARERATGAGALAIAAVVDLQLASSHALLFEPEAALRCVRRGIDVARLFDLGLTLPMLVVQGASAHATAGRRAEMEAAIEEALTLSGGHPEVWTVAWGHCRALLALLEEDRGAGYAALCEALEWSRHPECAIPGAFGGWLALVATLDDRDGTGGEKARAEIGRSAGAGIPLNACLLAYAEAVALGRAGRGQDASSRTAEADALLRSRERTEGWWHLSRRLLAEAAISDGWGEPVDWLRGALPWFEERGHRRVAAACRDLIVRAGAPRPRRGRGTSTVPPDLRERGVTSREVDVLALVGAGLSNVEIGGRLYLSPRTVEKHVERLRDKTAAASRTELARLAAKYGLTAG